MYTSGRTALKSASCSSKNASKHVEWLKVALVYVSVCEKDTALTLSTNFMQMIMIALIAFAMPSRCMLIVARSHSVSMLDIALILESDMLSVVDIVLVHRMLCQFKTGCKYMNCDLDLGVYADTHWLLL